jgi:RNA polymerase sigma-70 factor, ECF subfamily
MSGSPGVTAELEANPTQRWIPRARKNQERTASTRCTCTPLPGFRHRAIEQVRHYRAPRSSAGSTPGAYGRNLSVSAALFVDAMREPTFHEAIERVYRDYGAQLWRGVYAFSGGRADIADDAVAEAFARALENTRRIRSPLPWLYRVAFRQAAGRLRDERRQDALPALPESDDREELASNPSLDALALLTPQQRAVVFLFYYADLSIADVAQATGSSRVAVRVQLHRAREALRRRYGSAAAMRARSPLGGNHDHELA